VDEEEKLKFTKELQAASPGKNDGFAREKYYKVNPNLSKLLLNLICPLQVKWTRVPDLIEKRKVFLKAGWAYVPGREQSSIVFQEFEINLTKALEVTMSSFFTESQS